MILAVEILITLGDLIGVIAAALLLVVMILLGICTGIGCLLKKFAIWRDRRFYRKLYEKIKRLKESDNQ